MVALLFSRGCELRFGLRDPERAAGIALDGGRQCVGQVGEHPAGQSRERELRRRIVHDDDVPHAGRGGTAADESALDERDRESRPRQLARACRADDPAADDDRVGPRHQPAVNPPRNGSAGSKRSTASPVIHA